MTTNTIKMSEVKGILNHYIDTNKLLQEEGDMPIAVGLEAAPGIGKSSVVKQVAEERGMTFVDLNLSQVEEQGD